MVSGSSIVNIGFDEAELSIVVVTISELFFPDRTFALLLLFDAEQEDSAMTIKSMNSLQSCIASKLKSKM